MRKSKLFYRFSSFRFSSKILTVLTLFIAVSFNSLAAGQTGPCGTPYDKRVTHPYMIHATWMYNRGNACAWQNVLQKFRRIGGKVVMQFGATMKRANRVRNKLYTRDNKRILKYCRIDGSNCIRQTLRDLSREGINESRIANWLYYKTEEQFTRAILCRNSTLDRKITVNRWGKKFVYWRVVLPDSRHQKSCDYKRGKLNILFVETRTDKLHEARTLLKVAEALDMKVFLGSPTFPADTRRAWIADRKLRVATMAWSARVFRYFRQQYSKYRSFAGIYQTFEVALQPGWSGNEHRVYARQAKLFHRINPGRKYMISPYFMVNKDMHGYSLRGTVKGFRKLARAGIDIIIPQDGRGTGKSALFWPWQKHMKINRVDAQLARFRNVKPQATFASQYHASSIELFRALKKEQRKLRRREGIKVEVWANVEAFDEDRRARGYKGCGYSSLSQTRKKRIDKAITFAAGLTRKVASFMFDPLFTCKDRYGISLLDEIMTDYDRPVITRANWSKRNLKGLILRGHFLSSPGTSFKVVWQDIKGRIRQSQVQGRPADPMANPHTSPIKLNIKRFAPRTNSYIKIEAIGQDGRRTHESFSLKSTRRLLR